MGFPVEPEVYKIKSGASASIISIGQVEVTFCISSCHQKSLPFFIEIVFFVRSKTMHFSIDGVVFIASLEISLRGVIFAPLNPPSEVIRILQSASLILSDNDFAENPANTTEWIAPILAQAKTAIANSGIIGMYRQILSPFFPPLFFKTLANLHTSVYSSLYEIFLVASFGLFATHFIAVWFPLFTKCLSKQFSVIFNLPPSNHFTSGLVKSQESTLLHFLYHVNFSAFSSQNAAGSLMLFAYSILYCFKEVMFLLISGFSNCPKIAKQITFISQFFKLNV